jgi:recombination protein RecA
MKGRIKKGVLGTARECVANHPIFSSGLLELDYSLGVGGYMGTKVYEIFGPESSCKSILLYLALAEVQKAGYAAVLYDAERSSDTEEQMAWMENFGVDTSNLIYLRGTAEECLDALHEAAEDPNCGMIGIDSLAWLPLNERMTKRMDEASMRGVANLMPDFLRKYTAIVKTAALILINQTRDAIGVYGYNPADRTPGGRAVRFGAAARIQVKPKRLGKKVKGVLQDTGVDVNFIPVKNKLASPRKAGRFLLRWDEGIDHVDQIIRLGLITGVVQKAGAWLKIEGDGWTLKGLGLDAFTEEVSKYVETHAEIREMILAARSKDIDLGAFAEDMKEDDVDD